MNSINPFIVQLNFQKIVESSGSLFFKEVLSEVTHNSKKLDTQTFITVLENTGEIYIFDIMVLQIVVNYIKNLNLKNNNIKFSVNVSGFTINEHSKNVISVIKGVESNLIIEITETYRVDIKKALSFYKQLKKTGAMLALDDINDNIYSEEEYHHRKLLLETLKPDIVKFSIIDINDEFRIFFDKVLEIHPEARFVFERVETMDYINKAKYLIENPLFQGYYFHKPEPLITCVCNNEVQKILKNLSIQAILQL
jgi:EAL domain-containing protein (putative c-di-GMP-specific phosphodiesterase class I)